MFEEDYRAAFSRVTASADTKQKILALSAPKKHRTRWLIPAIAAVIVLLAACAAAVYDYSPMMQTIFGINGRETYGAENYWRNLVRPGGIRTEMDEVMAQKYIAPNIRKTEGVLADGDTRLSAIAYLVDKDTHTGALYLSLENPPAYEVHEDGSVTWHNEETGKDWYVGFARTDHNGLIGRLFLDSASTTEDTLYMTLLFACPEGFDGILLGLGSFDEVLTVPFDDLARLPTVTSKDGTITLTPFGAEMDTLTLKPQPKNDPAHKKSPEAVKEIRIRYRDGSEYCLLKTEDDYTGCSWYSAADYDAQSYVAIFSRVVDVEKVEALLINDREYPLS